MAAFTTVDDPSAYFKVQIYNSSGADNNAITFNDTATTMQPDLVWIKTYDTTNQHAIYDSVRGVTKYLRSNASQDSRVDADSLTDFDSNGFTVDADANGIGVNYGDENQVAWCWKESATSGFDIVSFTGNATARTISHSLSAVPAFITVKNIDQDTSGSGSAHWFTYHKGNTAAPETDYLELDTSDATADDATIWNDTAPTSSVFSVGTSDGTNKSGDDFIAYLFAEKQGFSKFGVYTGNGNADGAFVYTGFRPAFLIIMNADSGGSNKYIFDNKRLGYNLDNNRLDVNTSAAQGTDDRLDLLSNGFKSRNTGNPNTATSWVYLAFAEAPLVNSNGVPGCAK